MSITNVKLKDFRCFREEQTARLAPLTLLVGENSTGKTSFLAMIRALLDSVLSLNGPDFKEDPYDLGSFEEIVHNRGPRSPREITFEAGFDAVSVIDEDGDEHRIRLEVVFERSGTAPVIRKRLLAGEGAWIQQDFGAGERGLTRFGTRRKSWEQPLVEAGLTPSEGMGGTSSFDRILGQLVLGQSDISSEIAKRLEAARTFMEGATSEDRELLFKLILAFGVVEQRPFASAPVRSKPRRTYDPSRPTPDPEGDYVPMYLAAVLSGDKAGWESLRNGLEHFGLASGLFDEISIKRLGRRGSEPFQVQVRKAGGRAKGPWRNLIDVGYGVSQALPVMTEMLRADAPNMFLLQQPEVHLHPSAQAALGSLFCQVASRGRQLVVETHSDHLMDRVRMDVRDSNRT